MDWRSHSELFMPPGGCALWQPVVMSLHVVSDALIAAAYLTIPFSIVRFVRARVDLEPGQLKLAILFAAFIALCGLSHMLSIVVLWMPIYNIEGLIKLVTAVVSVVTAGGLAMLVPAALRLPSVKAMQAEVAAHRETSDLLSTVVELVPGLVFAKNEESRMLLANKATLDQIGKPWSEVEGKQDVDFLSDRAQGEAIMENDRRVLTSGIAYEVDEVVDHPEKGTRIFHSIKVPLNYSTTGKRGIVGFAIDITDRKRVDGELLHSARRAAMGDMATAIAHEINQPLAAISLRLSASKALLDREQYVGPVLQSLTVANEQCLRAGEIIRRLRNFVTGGDETKCAEPIVALVDEAFSLATLGTRYLGVKVAIDHAYADTVVQADRVQIQQVVVNLVRNALEAMQNTRGATLRVTSSIDESGFAIVSIIDNGPGIGSDIAHRIFEPFVSSKGVQGMGVGLSLCRTIVEDHGGKIWVDPNVDVGTTFHFILPRVQTETVA